LDAKQFETFLTCKNRERAINAALKDWDKLSTYQLTLNLQKEKVIRELFNYEINLLRATDRLYFEKTKENTFLKITAENQKPPLLQKLAIAEKDSSQSNLKQNYTW
jgi:hypothetical protein